MGQSAAAAGRCWAPPGERSRRSRRAPARCSPSSGSAQNPEAPDLSAPPNGPAAQPSVEARLAALEATAAAERLRHEYCLGVDRRDLDRFLSAWSDDAVWEIDAYRRRHGLDEIAASVRDLWRRRPETHHGTVNAVADFEAMCGFGTCDVLAMNRAADDRWTLANASYADEYVQIAGRWLIQSRTTTTHFAITPP